jgi:hypothetical protein
MKTKSMLKSRGQFGHRYPTSIDQSKAHALVRRRAWRCVRPVVKEPDVIALRKLEQIDFCELLKILEEEKKSSAACTKRGDCKTPTEMRRRLLNRYAWTHYLTDLYARARPDLPAEVKTAMAELKRSLKGLIRKLKHAGRRH